MWYIPGNNHFGCKIRCFQNMTFQKKKKDGLLAQLAPSKNTLILNNLSYPTKDIKLVQLYGHFFIYLILCIQEPFQFTLRFTHSTRGVEATGSTCSTYY